VRIPECFKKMNTIRKIKWYRMYNHRRKNNFTLGAEDAIKEASDL